MKQSAHDKAYRIFVTDALFCVADNTARISGGNHLQKRYSEIIEPTKIEKRTAAEIINGIRNKLGGENQ